MFKKLLRKRKKGMVALITVLLISSILLVGGMALIFSSIDLAKSTKTFNINIQTKILSRSCLEEGLLKIGGNSAYTGTITFTTQSGTCNIVITNDPVTSTTKVVTITATIQTYNFNLVKKVDSTMSPIKVIN
jgi:hypothetical protein